MIITIATPDTFYFKQLIAFLNSMKVNSPKDKIHVFLVDFYPHVIDDLKHMYPNYIFDSREVDRLDNRGISFILLRIELIKECFERYNASVAWVDIDVLVRKPLNTFLEVEPTQLKILYRGDHKPEKVRFNAGIFNIGYSKETYGFVDDWHKGLLNNAIWGMGQLEMYKAYLKHQHRVQLVHLDDKYNDLGGLNRPNAFSDDSVMWHCKKAHFNHPKFQKEFQYYLNLN